MKNKLVKIMLIIYPLTLIALLGIYAVQAVTWYGVFTKHTGISLLSIQIPFTLSFLTTLYIAHKRRYILPLTNLLIILARKILIFSLPLNLFLVIMALFHPENLIRLYLGIHFEFIIRSAFISNFLLLTLIYIKIYSQGFSINNIQKFISHQKVIDKLNRFIVAPKGNINHHKVKVIIALANFGILYLSMPSSQDNHLTVLKLINLPIHQPLTLLINLATSLLVMIIWEFAKDLKLRK